MRIGALLFSCMLLTSCNPFTDVYRVVMTKASPSGALEARLIYREANDPYLRNWVVQVSAPKAELSPWRDVVIEFPIDYKVESFEWSGEQQMAIEYSKGSSELSLRDFKPEVHGVRIPLKPR